MFDGAKATRRLRAKYRDDLSALRNRACCSDLIRDSGDCVIWRTMTTYAYLTAHDDDDDNCRPNVDQLSNGKITGRKLFT